jgi:hypothetical protein
VKAQKPFKKPRGRPKRWTDEQIRMLIEDALAVTRKNWNWSKYFAPNYLGEEMLARGDGWDSSFALTSKQIKPYVPALAKRIKNKFPDHWRDYDWESIAKFLREGPRRPRKPTQ